MYPVSETEVVVLARSRRGTPNTKKITHDHFQTQIDYMREIHETGLEYEGHRIAPKISAAIMDEEGLIGGYRLERMPGKSLRRWLENEPIVLTVPQFDEVARQVREQVGILNRHGYLHGDINPGNVIVDIGKRITVRIVDFEPPNGAFTIENDPQLVQRTLGDARLGLLRRLEETGRH